MIRACDFGPTRRSALTLMAGLATSTVTGIGVGAAADFAAFLETLWPQAQAKGVRRATFDAAVAGLTPDPKAPRATGKQAEFDVPLQTYYRSAVSGARIAKGRGLAAQYASVLQAGEQRFGVPGEIALAAWGMESDFGRTQGTRDIVRTIATLAFTRTDRPIFRDEFVAVLIILDRGEVSREKLRGSWAGAMGDPQFLPSAYLKYAVSASGSAAPDIWSNPADVLLSVAKFLHEEGWKPGEPWIEEVVIPQGFTFPTLHAEASEWARLGLRRPDGRPPSGDGDAALFLPSGAGGPAFLLFANYFVIKQYNNSDSYALSFGSLAQRISGAGGPATAWPSKPVNLPRRDKVFIQAKLEALGLYKGARDGKFGPKARDAIHAYQKQAGLTADGFATPALVASLKSKD